MTIFLNHSYDVPEDVFGSTVDAAIVSRAAEKDGSPIYDLDLDIVLNEVNPRAIETYNAIKEQGVKLGVSIGAYIEDYAFKDQEKGFWGGLDIQKVNLLEASIVGIPANPRSWVQNAVKAIKSFEESKPVELTVESTDMRSSLKEALEDLGFSPDSTKSTCPECGESDCEHMDDKSVTPEIVADAEPETPEAEDLAAGETPEVEETPAVEASVEEPTSTADLEATLEAVKTGDSSTATIELLRDAFLAAMKENADLTIRAETTEANFQVAVAIVEKIATLPIGRKASFQAPVADFRRKFSGIYDEGLIRLLDERTDD